jgi:hypothetical protein
MFIKHLVEKPDGSVVFQGTLAGNELAFVIATGLDTIIEAGGVPFLSIKERNLADVHELPDMEQ